MTKTQMIAKMAEETEMTKADVSSFLEKFAALAYAEAKDGFTLPGLGKLVLVDRKARIGRNPATGEEIQIPAKKVAKFKAGSKLSETIN